jgi:hypothetical protein
VVIQLPRIPKKPKKRKKNQTKSKKSKIFTRNNESSLPPSYNYPEPEKKIQNSKFKVKFLPKAMKAAVLHHVVIQLPRIPKKTTKNQKKTKINQKK